MSIYDIILKRRSIRRFKQKQIPYKILKKAVNAGRLAPSARNLQPLEYIVVDDKTLKEKVFSCLGWASYLEKGGPKENQRPQSYIIILINRKIRAEGGEFDVGLAAENIILTLWEKKIGSCLIGSVDREKLRDIINIPKQKEIALVLALGYPDEKSVTLEEMGNSIKYWLDKKDVLHVPKRRLKDILYHNKIFIK